MTIRRTPGPLRVALMGGALVLSLAATPIVGASAQDAMLPVPKIVIYPGDIIHDDMLMDVPADEAQGAVGSLIETRAAIVGKLARRTLLPGRAILAIAVTNPRAVTNGAQVTLVFSEGGLTIVTSASALQDGAVGDVIKVRNIDSGLTVSGAIQPDGSVRVSGG